MLVDNTYRLTIDLEDFLSIINNLREKADEILKLKSEKDHSTIISESSNWINEVRYNLDQYIMPNSDEFESIFNIKDIDKFPSLSFKKRFPTQYSYNNLKRRLINLEYLSSLFQMIDSFQKDYDEKIKEEFSTQEILDYILTQLNKSTTVLYYSIKDILKFNALNLSKSECIELADHLERKKFAKRIDKSSDEIKITVTGSAYIERKLKYVSKKIKVDFDNKIDVKIDQIVQKLHALGLGQEIIFEEFEELKTLHKHLNKKNWAEVLKGKLFNMAVNKLLEKETMSFIYEFLTDEKIKLN